ncbi:chromate transporter [Anaerocolumna sedimenticola]|uniref:Chromate transporter n=2 Tax=Anaerocolumna sedimenticola TaxID=2696063 RepID=A0A6P1TK30_9FIRM|nr:chromate transporter [Anaerocolumna sedimenticola]
MILGSRTIYLLFCNSLRKEANMDNGMKACNRAKMLFKLFLSTLYISAFTFGGGFVIITFMKRKFVDELHWLEEEEMLDLAALAQSSPGAIAVNAAILVGWRLAGPVGMAIAVLGTILPPMIILSVISFFYAAFACNQYVALVLKGMQAGVAAVILDVVCGLGRNVLKEKSFMNIAILVLAFVATFFLNLNVIYIILAAAVIGIFKELHRHRKECRQ